jgi:hypothetical protein
VRNPSFAMFGARTIAFAAALVLSLPSRAQNAPAPPLPPAAPLPPAPPTPPSAPSAPAPDAPSDRARYLKGDWPSDEKLISVDLDRRATREALKRLAEAAGWSLDFRASPRGRVHVTLNEVPADEALLLILREHDLCAERHGSVVTIRELPEDEDSEEATAAKGERVGVGQPVHVAAGETVHEAVSFGGDVDVQGTVLGDAVSFFGRLTLGPGALVKGDAVCLGCQLESDPGARVEGSRVSVGPESLGSWAKLIGGQRHSEPKAAKDEPSPSRAPWQRLTEFGSAALRFAVFFVLGLLMLALAPDRLQAIGRELRRAPVPSAGIGLVGAILVVPLSIIVAVTLVGIPAVVILWVFVLPLAVLIGFTAIALEIGARIAPAGRRAAKVAVLLFGLLAISLVGLVPYLGPVALWVLSLAGFGAVLRTRFGAGSHHDANFAPRP